MSDSMPSRFDQLRELYFHSDNLQHTRIGMWVTSQSVFFAFVASLADRMQPMALRLTALIGLVTGLFWLVTGLNLGFRRYWVTREIDKIDGSILHEWRDQRRSLIGLHMPSWVVLHWLLPMLFILSWAIVLALGPSIMTTASP